MSKISTVIMASLFVMSAGTVVMADAGAEDSNPYFVGPMTDGPTNRGECFEYDLTITDRDGTPLTCKHRWVTTPGGDEGDSDWRFVFVPKT